MAADPPHHDPHDASSLFGYESVTPRVKSARVREVFDSVSPRYDLMNDLMSAGLHRLWKRFAVERLAVQDGQCVLDLAGGTGDIARLLLGRRSDLHVLLCDINAHMLRRGRDRALDRGLVAGLDYLQADAEALPLNDASVDRVIIGFGLRNVTHKQRALAEMARVLRPGGRAVVLEFTPLRAPLLARAYDYYSFQILPRLGRIVAGDGDSYRYLAESIRVHPDRDALTLMMERAGFGNVVCHTLSGGVVAVHTAWKF